MDDQPKPQKPEIDKEYWDAITSDLLKVHDQYDRLIITLSGGALGLSFAFIGSFVNLKEIEEFSLLFLAWISWAISVSCILFSLRVSINGHKQAVDNYRAGSLDDEAPGGVFDKAAVYLSDIAAGLFVLGLIFVVIFTFNNISKGENHKLEGRKATSSATTTKTKSTVKSEAVSSGTKPQTGVKTLQRPANKGSGSPTETEINNTPSHSAQPPKQQAPQLREAARMRQGYRLHDYRARTP